MLRRPFTKLFQHEEKSVYGYIPPIYSATEISMRCSLFTDNRPKVRESALSYTIVYNVFSCLKFHHLSGVKRITGKDRG